MKILEKKNKPKKTKNIDKKVTKINTEFKSQNFIYTKKIKTIFIVIIFNKQFIIIINNHLVV